MSFSNLPPQAYTRDVLAAAYEWLRSQPQSVREVATSSDNLVSLYMQSRRRPGGMNQTSPSESANSSNSGGAMNSASAEAFKKDLKFLAEGLKQFDESEIGANSPSFAPNPNSLGAFATTPAVAPAVTPTATHEPALQSTVSTPAFVTGHMPLRHSSSTSSGPIHNAPAPTQSPASLNLDMRSLETLRQVQSLLNLGSEREALRMLIVLGFEKIKEILPR